MSVIQMLVSIKLFLHIDIHEVKAPDGETLNLQLAPHAAKPPRQHLLNIRRLPRLHFLAHHPAAHQVGHASFRPAFFHHPRPIEQVLHLAFPPLLLFLALNLRTAPLRAAIPALLQLVRRRLLEPLPNLEVLFELLEDVDVGGAEGGAEAGDAELEDDGGHDDHDERHPPSWILAELVEEGAFDMVDDVVVIRGRENDVPEVPAADAEDQADGDDDALAVHLDELDLDVDKHDAGGKSHVAHSKQIIVLREQSFTE